MMGKQSGQIQMVILDMDSMIPRLSSSEAD